MVVSTKRKNSLKSKLNSKTKKVKINSLMLEKKIINDIISSNNLLVSYSINFNNKVMNRGSNKIYPIHSISKLFTNIMVVFLLNDNNITIKDLNCPIQIDKNILDKLSKNVRNRLKNISIMDCLRHRSGLKNYLNNYYQVLLNCFNKNLKYPNPIKLEDFLKYADKDVLDKKEIGKINYSNLGILLVALSLQYYYNKNNNKKLSYNQILNLYIIKKLKLNSFSIKKPNKDAIYPLENDDLTKYVNGTPASGYWMSTKDLCKFGAWINKLFNSNDNIRKIIKNNNLEIYWKNPLRLGHWGFLQTSSSVLETYVNNNITIAIASNNNDDAHILMNKIKKLL